jgi:hypothetical protein
MLGKGRICLVAFFILSVVNAEFEFKDAIKRMLEKNRGNSEAVTVPSMLSGFTVRSYLDRYKENTRASIPTMYPRYSTSKDLSANARKFGESIRRMMEKNREKTEPVTVPSMLSGYTIRTHLGNLNEKKTGAIIFPTKDPGYREKGFALNNEYCEDGKRKLSLGNGRSFCVSSKSRKLAYKISLLFFILSWTCYYNFVG